ncbi:MAG: DUF1223 domain-containing protein [Sumerlaeia bacterium]
MKRKTLIGWAAVGAALSAMLPLAAALAQTPASRPSQTPHGATPAPTPVLVELFTSQGCSSCPPADRLLNELIAERSVNGAEVIGLAWHVDYWDGLGWPDPFASAEATARQRWYSGHFDGRVYTPMMMVNGGEAFVGSWAKQAQQSIASAAKSEPVALGLTVAAPDEGGALPVEVRLARSLGATGDGLALVVLLVEDDVWTEVRRGENRGRTLTESGIVRSTLRGREAKSQTVTLIVPREVERENARVVAFLQNERSGRVLGAAQARLP